MKLEILTKGVGGTPLFIDASLVICRLADGTPVMLAGEYGPDGEVRASHALDDDFNQTLGALGVSQLVMCDRLVLPSPPPGAKLLHAPTGNSRKEWPHG